MHTTGCLLILKFLQSNFLQVISWKRPSLDVGSQKDIGFSSRILSKNKVIFPVQYPCICWNSQWVTPQQFLEDLWFRILSQCCGSTWSSLLPPYPLCIQMSMKDAQFSLKRFREQNVALTIFQHEVKQGKIHSIYFEIFRDYGLFWFFSGSLVLFSSLVSVLFFFF